MKWLGCDILAYLGIVWHSLKVWYAGHKATVSAVSTCEATWFCYRCWPGATATFFCLIWQKVTARVPWAVLKKCYRWLDGSTLTFLAPGSDKETCWRRPRLQWWNRDRCKWGANRDVYLAIFSLFAQASTAQTKDMMSCFAGLGRHTHTHIYINYK